jgi:hypothetical protein
MVVKGHYDLVSADSATLGLFITSTNQDVLEDDRQRMPISRGAGNFELTDSHLVPGLPHVSMYDADDKPFAEVYFGTRAEVTRITGFSKRNFADNYFGTDVRGARERNPGRNQTAFSPVIERTIYSSSGPPFNEYSYLDLDTGRLLSLGQVKPPVDPFNVEQFYDWRQESGADVVAQIVHDPTTVPARLRSDFQGLVGLNTLLIPAAKSAWDSLSPQAVVAAVAPAKPDTTRWTMATTLTNGLPATHLFKTSEGGMGILQITGFTEKPRAVELRYKLVQPAGTNRTGNQIGGTSPAETATPSGQFKQTYSSFDLPSEHDAADLRDSGEINFQNVDVKQVLEVYEALSRRTVIRGGLPSAQITLHSSTPQNRIQLLRMLDTVLAQHGIAMVLSGDAEVKAVPANQAAIEDPPEITLPWEQLPDSCSIMTRSVQLTNVQAIEAVPVLQPFARLPNSIVPVQSRNLLILRDYASSVRQELKLLEQLEKGPAH